MSASSASMKVVPVTPTPADRADPAHARVLFSDVYDHYGKQLYNYACWQMGNVHDADDVFASLCEKVFLNLHRFDNRKATLSRWLFTIASNAVIDEKRGRQRRTALPLSGLQEPASRAPGVEETVIRGEQGVRLMRLVSTLSSREREIVGLRFSAGMSNQEIGRCLHLGEGNVAVILHRAIHRLRERLEREEIT